MPESYTGPERRKRGRKPIAISTWRVTTTFDAAIFDRADSIAKTHGLELPELIRRAVASYLLTLQK